MCRETELERSGRLLSEGASTGASVTSIDVLYNQGSSSSPEVWVDTKDVYCDDEEASLSRFRFRLMKTTTNKNHVTNLSVRAHAIHYLLPQELGSAMKRELERNGPY